MTAHTNTSSPPCYHFCTTKTQTSSMPSLRCVPGQYAHLRIPASRPCRGRSPHLDSARRRQCRACCCVLGGSMMSAHIRSIISLSSLVGLPLMLLPPITGTRGGLLMGTGALLECGIIPARRCAGVSRQVRQHWASRAASTSYWPRRLRCTSASGNRVQRQGGLLEEERVEWQRALNP